MPGPDPRPTTTEAPRPAARRDLPLLLAGAAASAVGGSLVLLAVMVHVEPAGPGWVAAAMAGELVPVVVLAPLAGRLVDRVRNRELLVAALGLQAVAVAVVALAGLPAGREPVLVAALALLGVGTAVANPVIAALIPRVAGETTRGYGWFSAVSQAGFLGGFALAGVLVEFTSVRTTVLAGLGGYLVLAAAVASLRTQRIPGPADPATGGGTWEGFRRVGADGVLLVAVGGLAAAVLASIVVNVAEVFYVLDDIGAGPGAYGLVTALWPAAGMVGGWLAGRVDGERRLLGTLALATVGMGLALLVSASVVAIAAVAVGWLLGGLANAAQRVCLNGLVRSRTPDAQRGRVFSAVGGSLQAANLLGLALGAGVVELVGARASLAGAGALTVVVGAVVWLVGRRVLEH